MNFNATFTISAMDKAAFFSKTPIEQKAEEIFSTLETLLDLVPEDNEHLLIEGADVGRCDADSGKTGGCKRCETV